METIIHAKPVKCPFGVTDCFRFMGQFRALQQQIQHQYDLGGPVIIISGLLSEKGYTLIVDITYAQGEQ